MKTFIACLALLFPILLAPASPAPPPKPPKIKVGLLLSTTGVIADFGKPTKRGVELAVKEFNKAGGIDGQDIEIVFKDGASDADDTRSAAKELAREHVVACIGCVASSLTLNAAGVMQEQGIPLVTPAATSPSVTAKGDLIFRACFDDKFQGKGLGYYAWNHMKAKTAAILSNQDDPYSTGLAKFFKQKFKKLGGKVVTEQTFGQGASDFETQVKNIKNAAPEVLFLPDYYSEVLLIAKEASAQELKARLLGGDGWESPTLLKNGAKVLEGSVFANHYCATAGDSAKAFAEAYKMEYNEDPNSLAAQGYDTLTILAKALKAACSSDGRKIAAALSNLKDFDGVTGSGLHFDDDRNLVAPLMMVKIDKGEFAFVREVTRDEVDK